MAAISARMVWEVRTAGSDTLCSGGYRSKAAVNATPSTPSISNVNSGGSVAANTYYFVYTYTDPYGDTVISAESATTTTGASSTITATKPAAASVSYNGQTVSATTWNCYCGTTSGGPYFPQGTGLSLGSNRVITVTPPTSGTQPLGSSDYSQQNGFQVHVDGATITATVQATTTNLKLTGHTVSAAEVGNTYQSTGGTATAGVYEIIGIIAPDTWMMNVSMGTSTQTSTGYMGGAFASPGKAFSLRTAGNTTWIKVGTYNLGNGTVNTAGNKLTTQGFTSEPTDLTQGGFLMGYDAVRGDHTGNRPLLQAQAASETLVAGNGVYCLFDNLEFADNGAFGSVVGFGMNGSKCWFTRIKFTNLGTGLSVSDSYALWCESSACTTGFLITGSLTSGMMIACYAHGGTTGFNVQGGTHFGCIASGCTNNGFAKGNSGGECINCVAYNCTLSGFNIGTDIPCINCLAVSNSTAGFTASGSVAKLINCAGFNTTNFTANQSELTNFVALSGDPFTAAGSGDFSLNNTAGAGAACRAAGIPGSFSAAGLATTTGHLDIGAVQHADPPAGGGGASVLNSGIIQGLGAI